MSLTVAVISVGAMGSAIGRRLAQNGVTVLTSLAGRSEASRARAEAAGMVDADDGDIVERASLILSVVPPADAKALAARFAPLLKGKDGPVFVDCNAIAPSTITAIADILSAQGATCVDGAIIGLPPKDGERGPALYVSGEAATAVAVLADHGIDLRVIDGPIGAASALKLSYAGITKGLTALAATMILAAERNGAGGALKAELAASQPQLLSRFEKSLPDMYPKAYRWVEEMHAIAEFVGADFPESVIYKGAADLFERLASEDAGPNEVASINGFLKRAIPGKD
jgi:3-hydroxyisobutyrate dehydrogenase-like beta-hydroxyacid dehydrogenase